MYHNVMHPFFLKFCRSRGSTYPLTKERSSELTFLPLPEVTSLLQVTKVLSGLNSQQRLINHLNYTFYILTMNHFNSGVHVT